MKRQQPEAENFDHNAGSIPEYGTRIRILIRPWDLERVLMLSDTANFQIPLIQLEQPDGTARFATIIDQLRECRDKITSSVMSTSSSAAVQAFLCQLDEMIEGKVKEGFWLEIDDPCSHSFIFADDSITPGPLNIAVEEYRRSKSQNEELGLETIDPDFNSELS